MKDGSVFEDKIKLLFDFQRYENNTKLADIIEKTIKPAGGFVLEDDQIEELYAAGTADIGKRPDISQEHSSKTENPVTIQRI
ncbi:hypothetical protein QYZ88_015270 [Lachnospiraceae bacterium C1.1]|nr:hypothetical protein [Lachnospiraceae bacterium C1.1]